MQRLPVESSDVVAIGYEPAERLLEIEFKEGRVYHYFEVEPDVYQRFLRADSFGQYFLSFINGHYRYKRVEQRAKEATKQPLALVSNDLSELSAMRAICQAAGLAVEPLTLPVDEIQSHEAEAILRAKVKQAYKLAKRPVLVTTSFWNILALRGFPGAYSRAINDWLSANDILRLLHGKRDRTAILTISLAYYDGRRTKLCTQDYIGTIVDSPRGTGQPLQQITCLQGHSQTLAEQPEQGQYSVWQDFTKWYGLQRRLGKA